MGTRRRIERRTHDETVDADRHVADAQTDRRAVSSRCTSGKGAVRVAGCRAPDMAASRAAVRFRVGGTLSRDGAGRTTPRQVEQRHRAVSVRADGCLFPAACAGGRGGGSPADGQNGNPAQLHGLCSGSLSRPRAHGLRPARTGAADEHGPGAEPVPALAPPARDAHGETG